MSYRDDRDADQARIAALEQELAAAKERVAELQGQTALVKSSDGAQALVRAGAQQQWYGPQLKLRMTRRWDQGFPPDRFEEIVDRAREHTGDHGTTELLKTSLTWSMFPYYRGRGQNAGAARSIIVTSRDGATTLVAAESLANLAGGIYGGFGGGVGGGGVMLPVTASLFMPVLAPVFVLTWFGSVFVAARAIYKRAAKRRAAALEELFLAIASFIDAELAK
ncbi:MAG TPA: hypothetical protein VGM88_08275 [Kofleriaceae bacterium]|jgi:hypothetical protein